MNKKPFLILSLTLFLLPRCVVKHDDWSGGLIKDFGEYILKKKGYILEVSNNKGLLHYSVRDSVGKAIITDSTDHISVYQKWAIFWDSKNNMWVASADIGTFY
jgi:hypothetical protein